MDIVDYSHVTKLDAGRNDDRFAPVGPRIIVIGGWWWLAYAVPFVTDAACDVLTLLLLVCTGGLLGFAWLIYTVTRPSLFARATRAWWLSVPLAGALGAALLVDDHGLMLRLALCKNSLNRFATCVRLGKCERPTQQWVGLFRVLHVKENDGGVYLFTSQGFLDIEYGIVNLPPGARPASPVRILKRLEGSWYIFRWKF